MPERDQSRRTPLGLSYPGSSVTTLLGGGAPGRHPLGTSGVVAIDLTATERFGLKGRGSGDWLASRGFAVPERINTLRPARHGAAIARLGRDDLVLLPAAEHRAGSLSALRETWRDDPALAKGFDAWRDETWAWFHVFGVGITILMAKTCPVDLAAERFAEGEIAQTRVAQMDCTVIRSDRTGSHGFDLLFDVASSDYMLTSLRELATSL